jgi:hypothetical protein
MELTGTDLWMQRIYWISQIALPLIALLAGWIALKQAQTFRLFEILKQMERPESRVARRIVMTEIGRVARTNPRWWSDDRLHQAAAQVSASYDHLGAIIEFHGTGRVERVFLERWGEGIVRTHEVLEEFLKWRRETGPQSYRAYSWVYAKAKQIYPNVRPPQVEDETSSTALASN